MRMENGDLSAIASKFLARYGNFVGKDDLFLIASASQLGREGVMGYVDSFLETQDILMLGSQKNCRVLPAPFILLGGCGNNSLIRAILEFHACVRISGLDPEGVLNDPMGVVEHHIRSSPGSKGEPMQDHYLKLPLNLPNLKKTVSTAQVRQTYLKVSVLCWKEQKN
jgi:hypothetical protein